MEKKTRILKLRKDDPEKELEFELEFMKTLTLEERFKLLCERMKLLNTGKWI